MMPFLDSGSVMVRNAYNARDRNRTDNNVDLTALARYTPNNMTDVEFGLARNIS